MVLQAFIDGSQKDGEVLVLAGYLAPADAWADFSDKWEGALTGPPKWPILKSKGARRKISNDPEFKRRYLEHYRIILDHVHASICVAVSLPAFCRVCDHYNVRRIDRNPYFIAFNALISLYVGHAHKSGIRDSVELIFDDQSEKVHINNAWDAYYGGMSNRFKRLTECKPSFKSDSKFLPLQAADLIASWKREEFEETGTITNEIGPMMPWETKEARHAHIYG